MLRGLCALLLVGWLALPASAALAPEEMLDDPQLEARARALSAELRCLVCQNQSIDDSNAPLARDLRLLVRERLEAGDSNREVMAFVVARYGEFVLLRPRFAPHTYALWLAPIILLLIGALIAGRAYRNSRAAVRGSLAHGLSAAERRKLKKLMEEG